MTHEGRLARGKANYEAGKFLNNSETIAYLATIAAKEIETKPKEKKENVKSKSR